MAWIAGIVFALIVLIGVTMLIALFLAIVKAVFEFTVRLVLASGLTVTVALIAGFAGDYQGYDGPLVGGVTALLVFIPALIVVWTWRKSVWAKRNRQAKLELGKLDFSKPASLPIEQTLDLQNSAELAAAWDNAEQMAPRSALNTEREACARFLASFETEADCDPEAIELATFIRQQVPGLVTETGLVLKAADEPERQEITDLMVTRLRKLGDNARNSLAQRHFAARERLAIRQERFAMRESEQRGWLQ